MDFSKNPETGLERLVNILVVDDEQTIRIALGRKLKRRGYTVQEAENGKKALEMIEKRTYSFIISDIQMPEMTGTELVQELLKRNDTTPIILMTGDPGNNRIPPGTPTFTKPFKQEFYTYIEKQATGYLHQPPPQP